MVRKISILISYLVAVPMQF